jgi:hypothetical protein
VLSYRPRPANGLFISPSTKRVVVPLHWAQHATTGRAGRTDRTCCIASDRPTPSTCPPYSTAAARSSNSRCAPTVKRNDRSRWSTDRTRRCAQHPRAQRHDRTRSTQRPDATVLASGWSPVSSLNDRTRPIACDRTRRASDQLYATRYTSGCPTGRAGLASDRTRQCKTLTPARLTTALN